MSKAYRIDRIIMITHKWQRKKRLNSICNRYLAKSQVANCSAERISIKYANFRGSLFKKVNFNGSIIFGCDFWGTLFNDCKFHNTEFRNCVFVGSRFKTCDFTGAKFYDCIIVNTNLSECHNLDVSSGIKLLYTYPKCSLDSELERSLLALEKNANLRKTKLLQISDKKYNHLNLFLLQKQFGLRLPSILLEFSKCSAKGITTYKKLESVLKSIEDLAIM